MTDDSNILYRTNYVEQLYQSFVNENWFGPSGTVFCGGTNFIEFAPIPNVETDIYIMNSFNGTSSQGNQIRNWLDASPNRVLLALSDDRTSIMISYLRLTGYVGAGGTGNNTVSTSQPRSINTGDEYTMDNNALYDYLFRSGPFTKDGAPIEKDQIKLLPYDASNNYISQWPSTMIPLILDPNNSNRMILGVDPTLRIIYTGEWNVFVYENQPSDTTSTETGIQGFVRDEVYAFLIRGNLTNTVTGDVLTRYWRVNLIRDDNYKMFRNTIYRVTLDELKTVGYGTAKEAEEDEDNGGIVPRNDQTGIQASIEIVPWRVRVQNTDF